MLTATFGRGILLACFQSQTATESERYFFKSRFSVALLSSFLDFRARECT